MDITGKNDYSQRDYIWRNIVSVIRDLDNFEYTIEKYIENEPS